MGEARRLIHRLAALPESAMRVAVLAHDLDTLPVDEVVALLRDVIHGARENPGEPWSVAVSALALALSEPNRIGYDRRAALYEAAKQAEVVEVARLFFSADHAGDEAPVPERPLTPNGRVLTLGERKSLARAGRGDLLVALARDPDASVIKNLLENPKLTEPQVLAITSRRPVREGVLRVVFQSRWLARYHVKRALIMNPHTPHDIAIRLLPALSEGDLKDVAGDASLDDSIRAQARLLVPSASATSASLQAPSQGETQPPRPPRPPRRS